MTTQIKQPRRLFNVDEYFAMAKAGILGEDEHLQLLGGRIVYTYADKPRLFDVDEYYAMAEAGILAPDERVELINGEIVEMSPIGSRHASAVYALDYLMSDRFGQRALVAVQGPLRLGNHAEPEPDVMVLKWRDDFYASAHPRPDDVLILIEVSDTTIDSDRNEKMPLYASAEIPEAWIVNIPERVVEVYTDPTGGVYRSVRVFGPGDTVSPIAFPDISLLVDQVIPG